MFHVVDEEAELIVDIAEAKYLIHFREHFPIFEVLPDEIDMKAAVKFDAVVDKCIKENKKYPKPDDYDERLY